MVGGSQMYSEDEIFQPSFHFPLLHVESFHHWLLLFRMFMSSISARPYNFMETEFFHMPAR